MSSNSGMTEPEASRVVLREWRDDDLSAFADLNADTRVMAHFPKTLTRSESDEMVSRIRAHFVDRGFGLWAVEVPNLAPFIGFVGLSVPRFKAHFTPCVEVGWRIAHAHWNQGFATEAARAVVTHGFSELGLSEIVSFTVPHNRASRRVMEKLNMTHDPDDDFEHPSLPVGHPHRRHVVYRLAKPSL